MLTTTLSQRLMEVAKLSHWCRHDIRWQTKYRQHFLSALLRFSQVLSWFEVTDWIWPTLSLFIIQTFTGVMVHGDKLTTSPLCNTNSLKRTMKTQFYSSPRPFSCRNEISKGFRVGVKAEDTLMVRWINKEVNNKVKEAPSGGHSSIHPFIQAWAGNVH